MKELLNLFAIAAFSQFRFASSNGMKTVEDLCQLPLTTTRQNRASLQGVALNLYNEIQATGTVDFVGTGSAASTVMTQKLELVKQIIAMKKAAKLAKTNNKLNAQHNESIDEIIKRKQTAALENMSVEELMAMKK